MSEVSCLEFKIRRCALVRIQVASLSVSLLIAVIFGKKETEVAKCIICEHISYAVSEEVAARTLLELKDYCLNGQTVEIEIDKIKTDTLSFPDHIQLAGANDAKFCVAQFFIYHSADTNK